MIIKEFYEFCDSLIELIDKENDSTFSYRDRRLEGYFHIASSCMIDSVIIGKILSILPERVFWFVGKTCDGCCKIAFYID